MKLQQAVKSHFTVEEEDDEFIGYTPLANCKVFYKNEKILSVQIGKAKSEHIVVTLRGLEHLGEYDVEPDTEVEVYFKR